MEGLKRKMNWLQLSSVVIIAFLTLEVIFLIMQNRQLRETCAVASGGIMKSGEQVQEFGMISLDNQIHPFRYSDHTKKYLFFILSPGCIHCENNLVQWNMIFSDNKNHNIDIFGISLAPAEIAAKYVAEKNIRFYCIHPGVGEGCGMMLGILRSVDCYHRSLYFHHSLFLYPLLLSGDRRIQGLLVKVILQAHSFYFPQTV